jgi:hypothetical protein
VTTTNPPTHKMKIVVQSKYWPCTTRRWASASPGWGNPIWQSRPIGTFASTSPTQKCEADLNLTHVKKKKK